MEQAVWYFTDGQRSHGWLHRGASSVILLVPDNSLLVLCSASFRTLHAAAFSNLSMSKTLSLSVCSAAISSTMLPASSMAHCISSFMSSFVKLHRRSRLQDARQTSSYSPGSYAVGGRKRNDVVFLLCSPTKAGNVSKVKGGGSSRLAPIPGTHSHARWKQPRRCIRASSRKIPHFRRSRYARASWSIGETTFYF